MMNRIQISPLATAAPAKWEKASGVSENPTNYRPSLQHQLFVPMHYEPKYAYPLIVWFHSAGDDPTQLLRVMPSISLRNYVAVGPQGPSGNVEGGYFWPQDGDSIEKSHRSTAEAIDLVSAKLNVASHRIFLAGFGSGGTMAFRVATRMVDRISGVISINGQLPQGCNPLSNLKSCRQIPVLWAHCRKSVEFPEQLLCDQLKLLHVAGFNLTVRQYPFGDELPARALQDCDRWIMESIETAIA